MPDRQQYEGMLTQHLDFIRKMSATICRRDGFGRDEVDDFVSWVHERLIDNDYAAFRKFRGESALTTYLTTVLSMLYLDYKDSRWGRWRASAEARRQGRVAVALERLVYRDGHSPSTAVQLMLARADNELTERQLFAIFHSLPSGLRGRPTPAGDAPLAKAQATSAADADLMAEEADQERSRVMDALNAVLDTLPPADVALVKMRFLQGMSVADIARALQVEQKPLYRRLKSALERLREELEARGISRQDLIDLRVEHED